MNPALGALAPPLAALAAVFSVAAVTGMRASLFEAPSLAPASGTEAARPSRESRRTRRHRMRAVDREVPQMLDLVAAGSRAGLSAELALRGAATMLGGPLGDDLRAIFVGADLGARWREDLALYAVGSGSRDLRRTVAVIERAERLGSPLTDASRDLAASVRQARRAATLERARTAPVKMLFPLVFLILPAFLLLTVVPVLLATVRAIG
ncbi:MAG: type II secretion system F family protein [Actinomycetota bacterium]